MPETKLILIEGLGGSGKTSTVKYLSEYLQRRNFDFTAIYERSECHPTFDFPNFIDNYRERMLDEWHLFLEERKRSGKLCLMEGHGWQPMAEFMYLAAASHDAVLDFCTEIADLISPLNPLVIYYQVDSITNHLNRIKQMRGQEWVDFMERRDSEHHGLASFDGSLLKFWTAWNVLQNEIFERCPFLKLRIENPPTDWENAYQKIVKFCGFDTL